MLNVAGMISRLSLYCLIGVLFACANEESKVERKIEEGTEVVINHLKPYKIKGEVYGFNLEEEMVISQERKDLIDLGLMSMGEFAVDSDGNIYIVGWKNTNDFIFKFDRNGNFRASFGRRGQGPGELQMPTWPGILDDKIYITDRGKKIVIYDKNGKWLEEKSFMVRASEGDILSNGKYLLFGGVEGHKTEVYVPYTLSIYDSSFRKVKSLDTYKLHYRDERLAPFFMWRVTKNYIFIINEERGYEILIYDHEGNFVRKIRKKYKPVAASKEIKMMIMGPQYTETGPRSEYVPDPLPPIRFFEADDGNRLFVMTYEKGRKPGEFMYDIFNTDGAYVGRQSLNLRWADLYFGVKYQAIKNNKLYFYRENENGYMELVVSKIKWLYR